MKLFEIVDELKKIEKMIEGNGGEVNESHEQLISELTFMLQDKTDGCAIYIDELKSEIEKGEKIKQDIEKFIKNRKNALENFKNYMKICMQKINAEKFVGDIYSIKITKPKKMLKVLDITKLPPTMVDEIPASYTPNMKEINKEIAKGNKVSGTGYVFSKPGLNIGVKSKKD